MSYDVVVWQLGFIDGLEVRQPPGSSLFLTAQGPGHDSVFQAQSVLRHAGYCLSNWLIGKRLWFLFNYHRSDNDQATTTRVALQYVALSPDENGGEPRYVAVWRDGRLWRVHRPSGKRPEPCKWSDSDGRTELLKAAKADHPSAACRLLPVFHSSDDHYYVPPS